MTRSWTTARDIRSRVRRRWDDGSLLQALAAGAPFPVIDLPVHGPKPGEIGDDLGAVQSWAASLRSGATSRGMARYELQDVSIGGRHIGRNLVPGRARITSYEQAWLLLGVADDVAAFQSLLSHTVAVPAIHEWAAEHPLQALALSDAWPRIVSAFRWLDQSRDSGRYLREIDAAGVDTKFVEQHRGVLAGLLGVPTSTAGFTSGLGLRAKPEMIRLRVDPTLRILGPVSEAAVRLEELAVIPAVVRTAVIIENEITYLSVPVPAGGVVLWGKGFEVGRAGSLSWLRDVDVHYWGDLDTHGFAILHQLRAWLPQTRSFLMDRDTLLAHADRWGQEESPTTARLDRLTAAETDLYLDLVSDRLAAFVRLEQERVDWAWVERHLPYC